MALLEKEWFIQAPWGRICIIAWGDCFDPPVLLCHGRQDSAGSFRPLVSLLPRQFYYIGLELPGNGKSDRFPPGLMINAYDMMYAIKVLVDHFRWNSFIFVAHSLGALLGKLYNLSFPEQMRLVVELDPTPAFFTFEPNQFAIWYHEYFTSYYGKYGKFNGTKDSAPQYTKQEAVAMLKRARGLTDAAAELVLERISDPVGDGTVRFTYDQRSKLVTVPPFSSAHKEKLYTAIKTPTLIIVAETSVKLGKYDSTPFALDESAYPTRSCRVRQVKGNHEVHIVHPERVAKYVGLFLQHGLDGLDGKSRGKL